MKNIKISKLATLTAIFFICSMMNFKVFAKACTNYNNGVEVNVIKASINGIGNIPPFNPGDYVNGQPIGNSVTGTMNVSNIITQCPSTYPGVQLHISGIGIPTEMAVQGMGSKKVFRTSMNGIGVVIHMAGQIGYLPFRERTNLQGKVTWYVDIPITITLVKTGDITAPGFLRGPFLYYREDNAVNGAPLIEFSFINDIAVTPRVPTCSVANSYQSVNLDKINASEVGAAGAIPAKTKNFNIKLNCSGGDRGTATRAFVTLTDANQANNFGNILMLQKTSHNPGEKLAEGIGLHIMKADNTILGFGPASSAAGNTNQWEAGKINQAPGTTEFTIPLKAGYVKTGVPIKAGKVRAQAIFTMSYQ